MSTPESPRGQSVNWRDYPTLSITEAGVVMRVSRSTAYLAVREGQWPTIKVGRRTRVLTAGLRRLLDEGADLGGAA